jgi:hypothetical protein
MIYEDYLTPDQAYYINAQSLGFDFCYLNKRVNFFGLLFDELNREGVTFPQQGILSTSNFDFPKRLDLLQFDFTIKVV